MAVNAETDKQIAEMVATGRKKTAVAKEFGITPAKVNLALRRHERRSLSQESAYLWNKMSVRMANVLHNRGIAVEDDMAVLEFLFNEREALKSNNIGRKTLRDSQAIARVWLELKPELQARFKPPRILETVSKAIFDTMDIADGLDGTAAENYARAAIKATLEHLRDNVSEGNATRGLMNCFGSAWPGEITNAIRLYLSQALNDLDEQTQK